MKTIWGNLALQVSVFLVLMGCNWSPEGEGSEKLQDQARAGFEVIAYFHGDSSNIHNYAIDELTQIIYSFLHLDGNRLAVESEKQSEDIRALVTLKKTYPELKVLVALGGWGGCESCSEVFSSSENRREFAESARELLIEFDLDGIDLDWEYPAIEGYPGHAFKPDDKKNFTELVRELRKTLGSEYELSFAAGSSERYWNKSVEWEIVMPLVDRVNLMTYDLISGDGALTEHHTALFSTPEQAASVDSSVQHLLKLGIEARKVVLGAAFYARVWDAVETSDSN